MQLDLAALPSDPTLPQQVVRELAAVLTTKNAEIDKLHVLIKQLQRSQFGRRSEQLDGDQLQLGLEDLEQAVAAVAAAQAAAGLVSDVSPGRPPTRRNRGALPAHLPRIEVVVDVEDKSCPCCGGTLHVIGEDRSEMLDVVPAQYRVKVIRRPRYGCRACEGAVVQAAAPERPLDGGMATEALIAQVLVAKYSEHLPLYRQAQVFARPVGSADNGMDGSRYGITMPDVRTATVEETVREGDRNCRARSGQELVSGSRCRCTGPTDPAQEAAQSQGAGLLRRPATVPGWHGSLWQRPSLGP
jgi:transposase